MADTMTVIGNRLDRFEEMLTNIMEISAKNAENTAAFLAEARNINNSFNTHIEYLQKDNERLRQEGEGRLMLLRTIDKRVNEVEVEIARRQFIEDEIHEIKALVEATKAPSDNFDKKATAWTQATIGKWAIGVVCAAGAYLAAIIMNRIQIK